MTLTQPREMPLERSVSRWRRGFFALYQQRASISSALVVQAATSPLIIGICMLFPAKREMELKHGRKVNLQLLVIRPQASFLQTN